MYFLIHLKNKELFVALYFLLFILGFSIHSFNFYNDFRVLEIFLLVGLGIYGLINKKNYLSKYEFYFYIFILLGLLFWSNYYYIFYELILFYLLYRAFLNLNYNEFLSKIIIWLSLSIFLILPIAIAEFMVSGIYQNWYPMPWNIRVYNSYLLVMGIFAVWFYLKEKKIKNIYLAFISLAFLSILLDGGRSAILAYSTFIVCICTFNRTARLKLLFTYVATWLTYFSILFFSSHSASSVSSIARETTSGRYELWVNAFQCWVQSPIFGCGFYQLAQYSGLPAHPHNLFIQVLTETGLVGFSFLTYIICTIARNISWNLKENYFVISAFIAVTIELSFSGIHVYPVTQVALLWLFIFLLKNPEFKHAAYFNQQFNQPSKKNFWVSFLIYILISIVFINLFLSTSALSESLPSTPPRFWEYGYQLF